LTRPFAYAAHVHNSQVKKTWLNRGKSMFFLCIILLGYTSGIFFKIYGNLDEVIFLYILNSILVAIDIALTLKYRKTT